MNLLSEEKNLSLEAVLIGKVKTKDIIFNVSEKATEKSFKQEIILFKFKLVIFFLWIKDFAEKNSDYILDSLN